MGGPKSDRSVTCVGEGAILGRHRIVVRAKGLPCVSCVSFNEFFYSSVPLFPHLQNQG